MARWAIACVRWYQRVVSPMTRPSCRFVPTCSQYAIEALQSRGFWVGGAMAAWRILRCNPLCKPGFDPVDRRALVEPERNQS